MNLLKSLNIERNEATPVMLLIVQSIFLGMFYGSFDIGAHTVFLKTFPESMIPKAYMISGVVGIILTAIYSKLQSKVKFSKLAPYNFLFISVSTLILWVLFSLNIDKWAVFMVFILLGPLNILAIVAFWGTVSRIFNLRQGKRIYGFIDSGQIFGIIISSYAIPFIIALLGGTKDLFLISAGTIFLALIIEVIISRKFNLDDNNEAPADGHIAKETAQLKLKDFPKHPYILFMAFFVIFSMFTAFFVQYSFLVVTNEQYPSEVDLAKYLAFFTGTMMIFTFIVKTFVYSKLIKTYGLKVGLMLAPVLIAVLTALAILAGFISGYNITAQGFIYFFLFVSLGKLFNSATRDAIQVPSFKLLYQSLNKKIRFDVQAKMDGTINEISALVSGILLSILSILSFIHLIHYSIVLFIILVGWIFIAIRLYKEYRISLENSLKTEGPETIEKTEIESTAKMLAKSQDNDELSKSFTHLKQLMPQSYLNELTKQLRSSEPEASPFLNYQDTSIETYFLSKSNKLPAKWLDYVNKHTANESKELSNRDILNQLKSLKGNQLFGLLNHIEHLDLKHKTTLLSSLLRSPDLYLQKTGIRLCGQLNDTEYCSALIEFLPQKSLMGDAMVSLYQMAPDCLGTIIQNFYKTDVTLLTQMAIIKLVSSVNQKQSIEFLLENLSSQRNVIFTQSVAGLKKLKFVADDKNITRMFHPITNVIQTVSWDIAALASLSNEDDQHPLKSALTNEYFKHRTILLEALSITYDPKSIKHIHDHLESGSSEGISYALELFDLIISEEIKQQIIPVFDDITHTDKTLELQGFFPVEICSVKELIINILNRDPNLISKQTKIIALQQYSTHYNYVTDDLTAQLFNPDFEIQALAASIIKLIEPASYNHFLQRVNVSSRKRLASNEVKPFDFDKESLKPQGIMNLSLKLSEHCSNKVDVIDNLIQLSLDRDNFLDADKLIDNYFIILEINNFKTENSALENPINVVYPENYGNPTMNRFQDNTTDLFGITTDNMQKLVLLDDQFAQLLFKLS